jgi:hypothetical protein
MQPDHQKDKRLKVAKFTRSASREPYRNRIPRQHGAESCDARPAVAWLLHVPVSLSGEVGERRLRVGHLGESRAVQQEAGARVLQRKGIQCGRQVAEQGAVRAREGHVLAVRNVLLQHLPEQHPSLSATLTMAACSCMPGDTDVAP